MGRQLEVLIPVWNGERHIIKCLDTIRQQDFQGFGVTIRDDGSTDGTVEKIRSFIKKHKLGKAWRLIEGDHIGLPFGRKALVEAANTSWVFFIDADDYLLSTRLFSLWALHKDNYDIVFLNYKQTLWATELLPREPSAVELLLGVRNKGTLLRMTNFYKKELFEGIEWQPHNYWEDYYINVCILVKDPKIRFIRNPLYFWRNNDEGILNTHPTQSRMAAMDFYSKKIRAVLISSDLFQKNKAQFMSTPGGHHGI